MASPDRPVWIDQRMAAFPSRPLRKVHLDFHNSEHVPRVGHEFDPEQFADTLRAAHIDSIVVFAKDMHGYFYYPTASGPVHPGLQRPDLLGEQVAACRSAGIAVYAYYCTTWDNHLAETRPEWLCFTRDRTTYLPRFDETPGWTALCLSNPDFVELMLEHSREILTRYEIDGIWYDMPAPNRDLECYCSRCLADLRARGLDPFDVDVQRSHKDELMTAWLRRSRELASELRPGVQVDQNNQTRIGLPNRTSYLDNIEIEALPTGGWGYLYFPAMVRYCRGSGIGSYGMTGRFHRSWADFGGLKHVDQLRTEVAGIAAQAAGVDVGDQLPPSGRLDPGAYATIGAAFEPLARLEPYLDRAVAVTEAVIVVDGPMLTDFGRAERPVDRDLRDGVLGMSKLLMENHVQFDVAEAGSVELDRYRLVVVPDGVGISAEFAARLRGYTATGGAVLAAHAELAEGITVDGRSPYTPSYLRAQGWLAEGLPDHDYALYEGTMRWSVAESSPWQVLARVGEPLFQRAPEHYTSHRQTPFERLTDHAAVVACGRSVLSAFPIGASYYRTGYWVYRELFNRALDRVLPARIVTSSAPGSADVAVTYQAEPERFLVHVVNYSAGRRSPEHLEYFEQPVPLTDVRLTVDLPGLTGTARIAPEGGDLPVRQDGAAITVTVPRVDVHTVVAFSGGAR